MRIEIYLIKTNYYLIMLQYFGIFLWTDATHKYTIYRPDRVPYNLLL